MKSRKLIFGLCLSMIFAMGCGKGTDITSVSSSVFDDPLPSYSKDQPKEKVVNFTNSDLNSEKDTEAKTDLNEKEKTDEEPEFLVLRDSVDETLGCRVGCAVTGNEINDEKVWDIITTHFNAVTLGNELKPDCMFGYSNGTCPGKETVIFNGEELEVPKLNCTRADKMLDKFLEWNTEHPDREIKVRGHVLVWHSQTPEWFFHENYNKVADYVDKDTMNKRLEWYISTILTYYTGENSKYKDLFYGWDVVNEAVSDGTGYRTEKENPNESLLSDTHGSNSSWWAIYQSNEYIINAFKYANKYAPESLELYYNDYNECSGSKQKTIVELLTAIKAEEGAPGEGTRISAMGMQGHYGLESSNPSGSSVSSAMKAYCEVVGNVQFTEVDLKTSTAFEDTEEGIADMNEKLRKRYSSLLFDINGAMLKDYVNLTGFTFWGTVDHYSWLQSRSNVGGGNTTSISQMPLLFDKDYNIKPCFYVFAKSKQ